MDIIYVGSVVTDPDVEKYSGLSIAGNKMELGIINNIALRDDNLTVVSIPPIAPFPKDKILYFDAKKIDVRNENIKYVSFLNIPLIKQFCQMLDTYFLIAKTLKHTVDPVILSYNMFPQNGIPVLLISKIYKCNFVAIIADPPIDEVENRAVVSRLIYKYYNRFTEWNIKKCRNVVVLNKAVIKKYCPNARSIVVEGGIEVNNLDEMKKIKKKVFDTRNIVYSGNISEYSGVMIAIEAMNHIKSNDIHLHIYGDGPLASKVKTITQSKRNVIYHGKVSNLEMIEIQKEAWVLINPRIIDNPISKYTFPSKILEYMLSGVPIITSKLNGIEDEYDNFLVYTEGDSPQDFSSIINSIDNKKYQNYIDAARNGRDFVLNNKNWKAQSSIIRDFLMSCK